MKGAPFPASFPARSEFLILMTLSEVAVSLEPTMRAWLCLTRVEQFYP